MPDFISRCRSVIHDGRSCRYLTCLVHQTSVSPTLQWPRPLRGFEHLHGILRHIGNPSYVKYHDACGAHCHIRTDHQQSILADILKTSIYHRGRHENCGIMSPTSGRFVEKCVDVRQHVIPTGMRIHGPSRLVLKRSPGVRRSRHAIAAMPATNGNNGLDGWIALSTARSSCSLRHAPEHITMRCGPGVIDNKMISKQLCSSAISAALLIRLYEAENQTDFATTPSLCSSIVIGGASMPSVRPSLDRLS